MLGQLTVKGLASDKILSNYTVTESDHNISLLQFLKSKNIPIASSCSGEGVCEKCRINKTIISCQVSVKNFIEQNNTTIEVDYL